MTLLDNAYCETRKVYRKIKKFGRSIEHQLASHHQLAEARKRLLVSPDYSPEEKALIGQTAIAIHPEDKMYHGDGMHYLTSGLSGLRCVEQCLEAAGLETSGVRSILDFPCGYGRVLRFLKIRFPDAYIAGCEIDPEALDFCRRSFSVPGLRSKIPISQLELDRKFDLIWCGSLLTHIDEEAALEVLRFFHEHLQPRGVCVFTTHGRKVAGWMENRTHKFMLDGNGLDTVVTGYKRAGYGYAPYPFRDDYGVSAASRDRMAALAAAAGDWREVAFLDAGWDNCQDVHAYQNAVDS